MADRYWVQNGTSGTGNWNATTHWDAHSGHAGGDSIPTSADNVYFDLNSFGAASQTVTVDATAFCLNIDWTGATNTPTLTQSANLNVSGNTIYILAMVTNYTGNFYTICDGANKTLLTNGLSLGTRHRFSGTITLLDNFTSVATTQVIGGTFNSDGFTMNVGNFNDGTFSGAKTITLGSSIINCASWDFSGGGLTLTANTATINSSGTGFAGGSVTTYNNVNLTGTAHTISGNNTFAKLVLKADTTQTITFAAGSIQTLLEGSILTGSVGKVKTLTGSGTWYLVMGGTLIVGAPVYASVATAGAVTSTKPTTSTNIQRIIGHANSENELYFNPDGKWDVA
jgi:hypothetical protein